MSKAAKRRSGAGRLLRAFGFSRGLGLALLVPLLALRVWDPALLESLRLKIFDLYQIAAPRASLQQPVVIVDIDEESLTEIGQWPWPRSEVASLVDRLREAGVVATGFDVVFAEPDRSSPGGYADDLGIRTPETREALRNLPSNDALLARALRQTRVVLGEAGYHRAIGGAREAQAPLPLAHIGGDPAPYLFRFPGLVRNIAPLENVAAGHAIFNLVPENDGIIRRVPAFVVADGRILPTLSVELLRVATGGNAVAIKTDAAGIRSFVVGGVEVPTDRNGRLWVHYAISRPDRYVSAKDLLSGAVAPERLHGKLALVGTSAAGLYDIKSTPLRDGVPGVEIHAQLLEMVIAGQLLRRPNYALGAEMAALAAIGLLIIALVPATGAIFTLLLGCLIAALMTATSWALFVGEGLLIDFAYPLLGASAVFVTLVFTNYLREESQRQRVRSAFRQYLSPALVDQLAREPGRLVLGGESREMTVLFSDVRGFTAISERLQGHPQELTRLMNRLLTPLSGAILDAQGTIDKYMGDAIMAFWNAPLRDDEHARNACRAALAMQAAVARLNDELAREAAVCAVAIPRLEIGIGVNSGLCVVGNMGSLQRFDYSVLGDAVNLASRLEGQCPVYGADIILGQATVAALDKGLVCAELDLIRVKGKREPQRIFALLGAAGEGDAEARAAALAEMEALLSAYRVQAWDLAEQAAESLSARQLPHLDLAVFTTLYRRRIADFRRQPPPADWDGIYTAQTK